MDRRLLEEAWEADEPPRDFAERVVERALDEKNRARGPRGRRGRFAVGALILAAAAALLLFWTSAGDDVGDRIAAERTEVGIGRRAVAVLETGAHVSWHGSTVSQDRGDVFYRVEPGGRFVVKTPMGEVLVKGTCFRVRVLPATHPGGERMKRKETLMAAGGAALGALVVVTVYEGRVQLSHAKGRLEIGAGESGKLTVNGAERADDTDVEAAEAQAKKSEALSSANDNLAGDIANLNRRLQGIEKEKARLKDQLTQAEAELARRTDGAAPRTRPEFDLDQDDWAELAKTGSVKFRVPCLRPQGWTPGPEQANELGLGPDDPETIRAAYQRSYDRLWKVIGPLCEKAVGSAQIADVLGPDTCTHVVTDIARRQDREGATEAMRAVSELRAGIQNEASASVAESPVYKVFWALTGELPKFEADLAQSFGPEEAHRLAYSPEMCAGHSTFGGPGPREPDKK